MSAGAVPAQAHLSRRLRLAPSAATNSSLRGLVFYFRFAHKILLPGLPLSEYVACQAATCPARYRMRPGERVLLPCARLQWPAISPFEY